MKTRFLRFACALITGVTFSLSLTVEADDLVRNPPANTEERAKAIKAAQDARKQDRQAMLKKYDLNRNGKLDPVELGALNRDKEALLKEARPKREGKLTEAERQQVREKLEEKRQREAPRQ